MASTTMTTPQVSEMPGVSGEYHTRGYLMHAARIARQHGFTDDRLWYIGDPTVDHIGEPVGFVFAASFVREGVVAGLILGALVGFVCAFTLPWRLTSPELLMEALRLIIPYTLTGGLVGGGLAWFTCWSTMAGRIRGYMECATGGALRLKIGVPEGLPDTERERLAELAERALREAKAESVTKLDGTRAVNSPQSDDYIA